MEELLAILRELHPDVDFENCDTLIDGKILDAFDVEIPAEELTPENFNSAKALWDMIQRLDEA